MILYIVLYKATHIPIFPYLSLFPCAASGILPLLQLYFVADICKDKYLR